MKKQRDNQEPPDESSQALQRLILAQIKAIGRGGLTFFAKALGVTPTMLKKRLASGQAFDAPTMRAVILVQQLQWNDVFTSTGIEIDGYIVTLATASDGRTVPMWRAKE